VRIDGELMEIWPNEVCDSIILPSSFLSVVLELNSYFE